ncbi:hypothetical protein BCEP4_650026 [Burkholderia cepacia]|nr:hypothetical protein BCEP4_650026 [Burkholderia cepacia]
MVKFQLHLTEITSLKKILKRTIN